MTNITTKSAADQPKAETAVYLFDDWFDPIEAGLRDRVRAFIETLIRGALSHPYNGVTIGRERGVAVQSELTDWAPYPRRHRGVLFSEFGGSFGLRGLLMSFHPSCAVLQQQTDACLRRLCPHHR